MSSAATAVAHCRDSIARGSKSFAMASRLFPSHLRDEAAAVYAFCRRADDAVDLAPPAEQPAAVERLRAELDDLYGGAPQADPALHAFQRVALGRGIPRRYPAELLAGMAMDASGTRYEDLGSLQLYCYRVAGTVGLMMAHVMGVRDDRALRNAAHLGIAMQLTNICRDVAEDWQRGRLYLPAELLARSESSAAVVRELLATADRFYRSGDRGLAALPWRCALAVRAARLIYADIGRRIAALGHDVLAGRVVVSRFRKLSLVGRALAAALGELPRRLLTRGPAARAPHTLVSFPDDVLPV